MAASEDLTIDRCGCCLGPAKATPANEGYSDCCGDRIEHPDEYTANPESMIELGYGPAAEQYVAELVADTTKTQAEKKAEVAATIARLLA